MIDRRSLLALALTALAAPALAQPAPSSITPALIEAAKKEGTVVWYTSVDTQVAEKIGKAFETAYPGVRVQVERSGAERILQRLAQERGAGIKGADVVNSSDAAHFILWKREGWLAAYVPEDVAKHWPADQKDPDGMFATWRATLSIMGYNTKQVTAAEAPKGFADLLDAKWMGKLVKAHPSYSGTILTATFQMSRDLGWEYFEKLSRLRVMQVQSATEPSRKVALGERPVAVDGGEYVLLLAKERGEPVEPIYPVEGAPFVAGPNGLFVDAPHPNAARLFQSWMYSLEAQQLIVDVGALRSVHPLVKEKEGRRKLSDIKLMKEDPKALESQVEQIKQRYTRYFKT